MKICIELDEEMEERWKRTKKDLESTFEDIYKKHILLTSELVFHGLLYCYEERTLGSYEQNFASIFSKEEVEAMPEQKP